MELCFVYYTNMIGFDLFQSFRLASMDTEMGDSAQEHVLQQPYLALAINTLAASLK